MQLEFSQHLLNLLSFFFWIYVPESGHISGDKTQTFKMTLADGNISVIAKSVFQNASVFAIFKEMKNC